VVAYGDGGGKAPAFPRPIHGRDKVARLLLGAAARGERLGVPGTTHVEINGQPGALFFDGEGRLVAAVSLDIADDLVQTVRAIANPDKLQHLIPAVDPGDRPG
jgi:RNA polymerase sigma-70 factor, ECF subfamily